jgi:hypothetical protein
MLRKIGVSLRLLNVKEASRTSKRKGTTMTLHQSEHIGNLLIATALTFGCGLLALSLIWASIHFASTVNPATVASAAP